MNKQAPRPAAIVTLLLFTLSCFGLLLFLWRSFGGPVPLQPKGYEVRVGVTEAAQLGIEADVRISGVTVGRVSAKALDKRTGRTLATLEIDRRYAPLPTDTRAMLRAKTILGETYVELTPGSRTGPRVPEGGRLPDASVRPSVQFDEVLAALDAPTRAAFQRWQRDFGRAVARRGRDINDAVGHLPAVASDGADLLRVLDRQEAAVRGSLRNGGEVFAAVSSDVGALRSLVRSGRVVFGTTATRREDLADTIRILPTFLAESRATLRRTERFSRKAAPVVSDLRPALEQLRPALGDLGRFAPDLRASATALGPLLTAARTGLPAATELIDGVVPVLGPVGDLLSELNPLLEWLEYNQRLTVGFFNAPAGLNMRTPSGGPETNGHLLRAIAPAGLESLVFWSTRLAEHRGNAYLSPSAYADRRRATAMVLPSFDCANTGRGAFVTQKGGTDDAPSCWTFGWPGWKGPVVNGFPRLQRAAYGR